MESVVDAVVDRLGDQRVAIVRLEIGELAGVVIDAMRFSFDVAVQGMSLADAKLDIVKVGGVARCNACGIESPMHSFATPCLCGSFDRELVQGHELRLVEVEVF